MKQKPISIDSVKTKILSIIKNEHGMSVRAFAESEFARKNELTPEMLRYLYSSSSVSFPAMQKLCSVFKLGHLERNYIVTREAKYYISKEKA